MRISISLKNASADKRGCNYFAVCLPKTVKLSNATDLELLNCCFSLASVFVFLLCISASLFLTARFSLRF